MMLFFAILTVGFLVELFQDNMDQHEQADNPINNYIKEVFATFTVSVFLRLIRFVRIRTAPVQRTCRCVFCVAFLYFLSQAMKTL